MHLLGQSTIWLLSAELCESGRRWGQKPDSEPGYHPQGAGAQSGSGGGAACPGKGRSRAVGTGEQEKQVQGLAAVYAWGEGQNSLSQSGSLTAGGHHTGGHQYPEVLGGAHSLCPLKKAGFLLGRVIFLEREQ